jgi:7,8-dihydropterin-6-yl-methyl-4-(beta-D-ribofuranosyl)aminobenzene 5'-phosphate synthase
MSGTSATTQRTAKIPEVEKIVITVITDNSYDTLRASTDFAKRHYIGPGTSLHAEHGLSYHIETVIDGETHAFMFDYGVDLHGVSKNLEVLKIDLKRLEALGLSHGHWDHWGNLVGFLKSQKGNLRQGIPLYVGEDTFAHRYAKRPDKLTDLDQLRREDIEELEFVTIVQIEKPTPIVPGAYLTGNIERVTDYEQGSPALLIKKADTLEHDSFTGEQGLMFNVKGKGLVVLTSCAHAGIVNTTRHARRVTGIDRVHAILGGFHLTGAKPETIQKTVADIRAFAPEHIIPMHCTGFETIALLAKEMPDQFFLNTVGTQYTFGA